MIVISMIVENLLAYKVEKRLFTDSSPCFFFQQTVNLNFNSVYETTKTQTITIVTYDFFSNFAPQ